MNRAKAFYLILGSLLGIDFSPNLIFARSSETTLQKTEQQIPARNFSDRIEFFELINWFYKWCVR